jgi:hypothetical protein
LEWLEGQWGEAVVLEQFLVHSQEFVAFYTNFKKNTKKFERKEKIR